jgi:hypothetical protein
MPEGAGRWPCRVRADKGVEPVLRKGVPDAARGAPAGGCGRTADEGGGAVNRVVEYLIDMIDAWKAITFVGFTLILYTLPAWIFIGLLAWFGTR